MEIASPSVVERLLSVDQIGESTFETTIAPRRNLPRLFGGQVVAQSLLAATRTVESSQHCHSLHAYFIRMGKNDVPVTYEVDRTRDGRSFSTRHVKVLQEGKAILEMMASFHTGEPGGDWQMPTPPIGDVPAERDEPAHPRMAHLANHLDVRLVEERHPKTWRVHPFWFRTDPPIGDDPATNLAMLAYVSDIALMASAREPGKPQPMAVTASLDHAIWFHRQPKLDEWLLFSTEGVAHIGTRGVARGYFHTADGVLVATVTQEGLLRPAEQ